MPTGDRWLFGSSEGAFAVHAPDLCQFGNRRSGWPPPLIICGQLSAAAEPKADAAHQVKPSGERKASSGNHPVTLVEVTAAVLIPEVSTRSRQKQTRRSKPDDHRATAPVRLHAPIRPNCVGGSRERIRRNTGRCLRRTKGLNLDSRGHSRPSMGTWIWTPRLRRSAHLGRAR